MHIIVSTSGGRITPSEMIQNYGLERSLSATHTDKAILDLLPGSTVLSGTPQVSRTQPQRFILEFSLLHLSSYLHKVLMKAISIAYYTISFIFKLNLQLHFWGTEITEPTISCVKFENIRSCTAHFPSFND